MSERIQLFREETGFIKLFTLFKEKYRSLGRIGGTVSIQSFTYDEIESIGGFLGQSAEAILGKGKISLLSFEKELSQTGFADYSLIQLIEEVLGESIITKNEESSLEEEKEKGFFQKLRIIDSEGSWWWDWIESKPPDSRWVWSLYRKDSKELTEKLVAVSNAFQDLTSKKNKFERLSLFAQRTSGNPHFFDSNQITGRLLSYCMYVDQQLKGHPISGLPKTTEELNELLSRYGLMRDDLWSFVTCRGLLASWEKGIHPVWQAAVDTDTVLNVPIKELLKLNHIWPHKGKKVWIVENSSVCSTLMDEVPNAPIICTHGQFRVASWILLDKLVESECQLYYSGDLDPEGISIAQRLKDRYENRVTIWRMNVDSYEISISDEDISSRLSKLELINSVDLVDVVKVLKESKKAGYQEGIVNLLVQDIKREFLDC